MNQPSTHFAPAGRSSAQKIREIAIQSVNDPIIQVVLEAVSGMVLILNEKREILSANQELLNALGLKEMEKLIGLRPGELLECEHCREGPDGCGTAKNCRFCGAVLAILAAQAGGQPAENECWLTSKKNGKPESREFRVRVSPLYVNGHDLLTFVLHDISSIKRRDVLERVFFHDIRNTLSGLMNLTELLRDDDPKSIADMVFSVANQLNREIDNQYIIISAENGELITREEVVSAKALFRDIMGFCSLQADLKEKTLRTQCKHPNTNIVTDYGILMRVLINMLKNAFEATKKGSEISLSFDRIDNKPLFSVHNPGEIQPDIAARIFQRSFSTKAQSGRGIGTYSMKLLGEGFLHGNVDFSSNPYDGTTFRIILPH